MVVLGKEILACKDKGLRIVIVEDRAHFLSDRDNVDQADWKQDKELGYQKDSLALDYEIADEEPEDRHQRQGSSHYCCLLLSDRVAFVAVADKVILPM